MFITKQKETLKLPEKGRQELTFDVMHFTTRPFYNYVVVPMGIIWFLMGGNNVTGHCIPLELKHTW